MSKFVQRVNVEYTVPILEEAPAREVQPDGSTTHHNGRGKKVGERKMSQDVVITIDVDAIARTLAVRACQNKTGRSQDGHVTCKAVGNEFELSHKEW